ncbi:MFS transporter [Streptomyces sp. AV19]|uniref:MFS transporter n=1 Tax=Streptomyces sp. AV19 TaxID=2793068 RepID=UPI0018FEDC1E|nr:MFS transporter [Streptomyces sp. AV19]MBH1934569.1 MFS transporter [Streptomyces sp. AV19]MDG4530883.1 MFS transporter [Streptomyces sp. AV19]
MTASPSAPPSSAGRRKVGFALCLVTMLLAVLDQNIVSAVTVPIVEDLDPARGIDRIPWLISAFALASTAVLPLYGKLCDTLGAKRVFLGAVAVFLAGSALCGAAGSMDQLIAFRAVQGIGGGGLMSVTMVVIAQLKGPDEKGGGKGSAVGGLVAGTGMALGPLLGAFLSDHADWRWIFYVNLPVGIAVLVTAAIALDLPHHGGVRRRIDFLGAALAAAFSTALLLVTEWGGREYGWGSPVILGLLGGFAALLALFLWRQATAAEPVLPLSLFASPVLRVGFAVQALVGLALIGAVVHVMLYLQVARGIAPTSASLFMLPMALGMAGSGLVTARLGRSPKASVISGTLCSAVAMGLLALTSADTGLWIVRGEMLLLGAGFGQVLGQLIVLVQRAAPRHQLGVATTAIRFFQTLGMSLGSALFGTVLARVYAAEGPGGSASGLAALRGAERGRAVEAFVSGVDVVFAVAAGLMGLALLLATRLRVAGESPGPSPREGTPLSPFPGAGPGPERGSAA